MIFMQVVQGDYQMITPMLLLHQLVESYHSVNTGQTSK